MEQIASYDAYNTGRVARVEIGRCALSADLATLRRWEATVHRWEGTDRAGAPLVVRWVDWTAETVRLGRSDRTWYEIAGATTMPREPWRGSQFCGWQAEYGTGRDAFCAQRKAPNSFVCRGHLANALAEGVMFAPGNAVGDPGAPLGAAWEPLDGGDPVPFTAQEMATYAPGEAR